MKIADRGEYFGRMRPVGARGRMARMMIDGVLRMRGDRLPRFKV